MIFVLILFLISVWVLLTIALWKPARRVGRPWLLLVPVARERLLGRMADRCALPGKPTNKENACTLWAVLLLSVTVLMLLLGLPMIAEAFRTSGELLDPETAREANLPGAAALLGVFGAFAAAFFGMLLVTGLGTMLGILHIVYAATLWPLFRTSAGQRAARYELLYVFIPPAGAAVLLWLLTKHPDFPPEGQEDEA